MDAKIQARVDAIRAERIAERAKAKAEGKAPTRDSFIAWIGDASAKWVERTVTASKAYKQERIDQGMLF
jgi:hypothetical protein